MTLPGSLKFYLPVVRLDWIGKTLTFTASLWMHVAVKCVFLCRVRPALLHNCMYIDFFFVTHLFCC